MKTRRFLARFRPYEWETPTREIAAKAGIRPEQVRRLDTNASPFPPSSSLRAIARKLPGMEVNQYPDTSYLSVRKLLSQYCGLEPDRFVITNGADEGLDIISKIFLDAGDDAITAVPTYSMFKIATEVMDARLVAVPRTDDFAVDVEKTLDAVGRRTRLLFLCNPNNPTGNKTPVEAVASLAERTRAVVVIDEAYFEFCCESALRLTERYDNVVIIRTFSKAFSMAGVRVGYLVASKSTTRLLNKVRPPNSLTVISLALAEHALRNRQEMRRTVRTIVSERKRCYEALKEIGGIEPYPSHANFILFKVMNHGADRLHRSLMKKGFVLRNLSDVPGIENCLRLTISTPEVNGAFLDALGSSLGHGVGRRGA